MTKSINKIIKYTVLRTTLRSFFLKNKSNTITKKNIGAVSRFDKSISSLNNKGIQPGVWSSFGPFSSDVRDIQKDIFEGKPPQNLDFK